MFCPKCGAKNNEKNKFCVKCGAYLRKGTTNAKLEKRGVSEIVFVDGSIQSVHDKIIDYFNSIKAKIEQDQVNRVVAIHGSKFVKPYTTGWVGLWLSKKLPKRIIVELEEQNGLTKATIRVEENYGFGKKKWMLDPLSKAKYDKELRKTIEEIKNIL